MLSKGPAKKVIIYLSDDARHHAGPVHDAIMTFLMHKGVAGATATRALSGFGSNRLLHTPKIEVLAYEVPVIIEFVETAAKVEELLPALGDLATGGLIEVQDTTVVKIARLDADPEPKRAHIREASPAKLMRVFLGEADKWHNEPLYEAIVKKLRMMDVCGATVYRGILGYGAKGHTHKQSLLHMSRDLPVMISVIDAPEKIAEAAEAVENMLEDGLIVMSDVDMVRLVRRPATEAENAERTAR